MLPQNEEVKWSNTAAAAQQYKEEITGDRKMVLWGRLSWCFVVLIKVCLKNILSTGFFGLFSREHFCFSLCFCSFTMQKMALSSTKSLHGEHHLWTSWLRRKRMLSWMANPCVSKLSALCAVLQERVEADRKYVAYHNQRIAWHVFDDKQ